ncbi:hypothetical protein MFIFM68171_03627 [Madurella fahalii]|uniref:Zn(2)-C6 fungal-type domain-containing protein n=1 Tax=Madurella fahalii TaxID=1157608 RepID=A0ABQ0G6N2_9PEZI
MSCFKAKCRCIPRREDYPCERCHRLKRHCAPSTSIRRHALDQRQDSDDRIARLESLVSLLQSQKGSESGPMPQVLQARRTYEFHFR